MNSEFETPFPEPSHITGYTHIPFHPPGIRSNPSASTSTSTPTPTSTTTSTAASSTPVTEVPQPIMTFPPESSSSSSPPPPPSAQMQVDTIEEQGSVLPSTNGRVNDSMQIANAGDTNNVSETHDKSAQGEDVLGSGSVLPVLPALSSQDSSSSTTVCLLDGTDPPQRRQALTTNCLTPNVCRRRRPTPLFNKHHQLHNNRR
jgi:hypothetical protein